MKRHPFRSPRTVRTALAVAATRADKRVTLWARRPDFAARLAEVRENREYLPGVMLATVIAVAASFVSEHYGGPKFLYALLIGIAAIAAGGGEAGAGDAPAWVVDPLDGTTNYVRRLPFFGTSVAARSRARRSSPAPAAAPEPPAAHLAPRAARVARRALGLRRVPVLHRARRRSDRTRPVPSPP